MFDVSGRKVILTGGTGGIGRAISKRLVDSGAIVTISGTKKTVLDEISSELSQNAFFLVNDLSESGAVETLLSFAYDKMGEVDILINNAGITRDGLMVRMGDDDWLDVIAINLTAGFKLARGCLKSMMKNRWGRIINISSVVGFTGNPGQANYAASKAGIIGMTKSLAAEVASRNITVNCIAPGYIKTAMTESLTEKQTSELLKLVPSGRMGVPEDIAASVLYLSSEEASYLTGQTIHINGGLAMF
ncbi:MAG: 3-oxoacyl-[acyl-carrier-protein] reductase [Rhodospirillaceae bacterium]|nr:3-oxoacyl-[acyl-carrier-protein] reductase [Rhodospirillaceae bacterium]